MEMARSFRGYSRNSDVGVDESESAPLTPSARNVGIESTGGAVPLSSKMARSSGRAPPNLDSPSASTIERWEAGRESYIVAGRESYINAGTSTINEQVVYDGRGRVRVREQLSPVEEHHWKKAERDACLGKGRRGGLQVWPKFFDKYEDVGQELKDGLMTVWTAFITAEVLLISVAMQPFVTTIPNLNGWQLEVYGLLWMLVLLCDIMNFAVTALFLGYLHAYPGKLTYMWLCNIGSWASIPSILVLVGALTCLAAIAFSSWVIYGARVGIICAVVEVPIIIFCIVIAIFISKASRAMEALR